MEYPVPEEKTSKWLDSLGSLGGWGKMIVVIAPVAWGLLQRLEAIQYTSQENKLNVEAVQARVVALELHRESDTKDYSLMQAEIAALKNQSDQTLSGVNELRGWLMQQQHRKGE
jgi:hypothetical protein